MKTEHILIIRFSAMGDVAMTVPVISSLARQYPNVRITVLSKPFARVFFEHLASNVSFMGADIKGEYHGVKGLNALYRRLSAKHFTAIADLHDTLRSKYLRMRFNLNMNHVAHVNKHRLQRRRLTSQHDKHVAPLTPVFDHYAEVFRRLGYPINIDFDRLPVDTESAATVAATIGNKPVGQHWIGIAPFAAHYGKIYPLERMEAVLNLLTRRLPDCRLFLFGATGKEQEVLSDWAARHERTTNVPSQLHTLNDELALISQLDVLVSMDSANMHFASLVGTPVVSIWGATHPYAGFMGWHQSEEHAVQVDLSCRPCSIYGKKACHRGDYACLSLISPEMIVGKVLRTIGM